MVRYLGVLLLLIAPNLGLAADTGIPALQLVTNEDGSQSYSVTLQILALMMLDLRFTT